jgi:hypothetical protein
MSVDKNDVCVRGESSGGFGQQQALPKITLMQERICKTVPKHLPAFSADVHKELELQRVGKHLAPRRPFVHLDRFPKCIWPMDVDAEHPLLFGAAV